MSFTRRTDFSITALPRSIYDDDVVLPKLEGQIRAIFHGRYASNPDLEGRICFRILT